MARPGQEFYTSAMRTPRKPASPKTPEDEARAISEREENRRAKEEGRPLPHPNLWDALDPTKIDPAVEVTPERYAESVRELLKICRPRPRKRHTL